MPTKKYCEHCQRIGPRKELEKRSADRLKELEIKFAGKGYNLDDGLFDYLADKILRQERLLPLDEVTRTKWAVCLECGGPILGNDDETIALCVRCGDDYIGKLPVLSHTKYDDPYTY